MVIRYGEKTNTTMPAYPDFIEGPMKDYYGTLKNSGMLSGLDGWSGKVAGMNETLRGGIARANENSRFARQDFSSGILGAGKGYTPTTISGTDIAANMSPYLETVGKSRLQELDRSYDDARARADASAASGVAFAGAGSGNALRQAQLDRGEAIDSDNIINGILSDGWNQAAGITAQNAGIMNDAGAFNAQQGLQAAMGADAAYGNYFDRMSQAGQAMIDAGLIERGFDQETLDLPWTNFSRYGSALQGAPQGSTEITPQYFDPLALIGGLGMRMFGL